MDFFLRTLARWKARRKAAQIIVFDGGSEVERSRSFLKGAMTGIGLSTALFMLTAPRDTDTKLVEEVAEREALLRQSNQQLGQAVRVADVCLETATRMNSAIDTYESYLGKRNAARIRAADTGRTAD